MRSLLARIYWVLCVLTDATQPIVALTDLLDGEGFDRPVRMHPISSLLVLPAFVSATCLRRGSAFLAGTSATSPALRIFVSGHLTSTRFMSGSFLRVCQCIPVRASLRSPDPRCPRN